MIPDCPCGKKCHVNRADSRKGYTKFCSDACSKKYRTQLETYNVYMSDYNWLYNQRFVLKKSKGLIGSELGCSETVVNKWLKFHNMPKVKYNESNTEVLLKLKDYDWLYNEYVVLNKTCDKIADEINSSKSTISIWLAKHSIETKEPNSYDRKIVKVSNEEIEVLEFIQSIYDGPIIQNSRSLIPNGLEIDIYLPELKIAIEYNGTFSHMYRPNETFFASQKGPKYHLFKTEECEKLGIQLLHIFSSSWKQKKEVWKNFIRNKLNKNNKKLYAKHCTVKTIDVNTKNEFLENNHLQGKDKSKLKYGLFYNDELVSVITFGNSRFNKKYDWELIRYSVKGNYNIIGGFAKLLSHMRKNNTGSIISYADRTYSQGKIYDSNNFKLIKINRPNYYYILKNYDVMINRMNLTKKQLLKKLNKPNLTEHELAAELGYNKIYDCGTLTYVLE